jgi:hypothetical protein
MCTQSPPWYSWRDCEQTATSLLAATGGDTSARGEAKRYLHEAVASGPRPLRELKAEARGQGISLSTFTRARDDLAVAEINDGKEGKLLSLPPALPTRPTSDASANVPNVSNVSDCSHHSSVTRPTRLAPPKPAAVRGSAADVNSHLFPIRAPACILGADWMRGSQRARAVCRSDRMLSSQFAAASTLRLGRESVRNSHVAQKH